MLGGCVFLASLSFSLVVEAIQTLIHIVHQDSMHQPKSVFFIGLAGIVIHGMCYLLLGGKYDNIFLLTHNIQKTLNRLTIICHESPLDNNLIICEVTNI